MAIDYIQHIKPLEDDGLSDADILDHINARTVGPISCAAAKVLLEENGLVVENPVDTSQKSGSLVTLYQSLPDNAAKANIGWFISHVFGRGQEVSSDSHPRAIQIAGALASLPPAMQPVGDALLALGGGKLFPEGVVQADLDASRQAYSDEQAEQARRDSILALQAEIENDWINTAVSDGTSTAATVRAAIKAGL